MLTEYERRVIAEMEESLRSVRTRPGVWAVAKSVLTALGTIALILLASVLAAGVAVGAIAAAVVI